MANPKAMENMLIYILQVNILLVFIYLGYAFLLKGLTFYRLNRIYFLAGTLYALVFPFIDLGVLLRQNMNVQVPVVLDYVPFEVMEEPIRQFTLDRLLLGVIILVGMVFLLKLLMRLLSLGRIHFYSQPSQWRHYLFRNVLFPIVPFSFFNKIYVHQAQHEEPELHDIFKHEDIHVKGLHTVDILWFEMLLIGCWYNPFVWLMRKAIRQNLEFLTDQQVLDKGVDRQAYQYSLLHVTQRGVAVGISNHFNFKSLKKRIMMMNKKRSSKLELSKYAFLLPIVILVGASFTVSKAETKIAEVVELAKEIPLDVLLPQEEVVDTDVLSKKLSTDTIKEYPLLSPDFNKEELLKKNLHYVIDGKQVTVEEFLAFPRTEIYAVDIYKKADDIFRKIGVKNSEGLFVMTSKGAVNGKALKEALGRDTIFPPERIDIRDVHRGGAAPLYIVDGKEIAEIGSINPNNIESITVLKDKSAVAIYGEKGKNGVVGIKTKNRVNESDIQIRYKNDIKPLKSRHEIERAKNYLYVYDDKAITKAEFFALPEVFEIQEWNFDKESLKFRFGKLVDNIEQYERVISAYSAEKSAKRKKDAENILYIVDGEEKPKGFDLKSINPNDIESISVWKDAKSIEKYGEKGKYGVIEIKMKEQG